MDVSTCRQAPEGAREMLAECRARAADYQKKATLWRTQTSSTLTDDQRFMSVVAEVADGFSALSRAYTLQAARLAVALDFVDRSAAAEAPQ